MSWENKVNQILALHASTRMNGNKASERTQTLTRVVVYASMRRWHAIGYKIEDPHNLKGRHFELLVRDWWFTQKKKIKTIQNDLSRLRCFCKMMGKPGMVKKLNDYLHDVDPKFLIVHSAATKPKSWDAAGLDMISILEKVDARDRQLGLMLRIELAFGFRREEVLKCDVHAQDCGRYFAVYPGQGKGGRDRTIPTMTDAQRQIVDFVKSKAKKNLPLGWELTKAGKIASLEENIKRYENLMSALGFTKKGYGVTGHGLRAQFAENHALVNGIIPPSMGGTRGQMNKVDLKTRLQKISEAMGHHRVSVMTAYYCSFGKKTSLDAADLYLKNIDAGLSILAGKELPVVMDEWREDCIHIRNTMEQLYVEITLPQVQALWKLYCNKNGVEWMKPELEIGIAIQSSALTLIKTSLK